jgi:hypothetical protein
MKMEHVAARALERVTRAADVLWEAVSPGDELGGPREDLEPFTDEKLREAVKLLNSAEDVLGAAIGPPDVSEGMKRVREASDTIELTQGLVPQMPRDVVIARADALRLLDGVTGRS